MLSFLRLFQRRTSTNMSYAAPTLYQPLNSKIEASLTRLKRDALRMIQSQNIDAHLFTLFEELKAFSVLPQNALVKAWQYPFLSIEDISIKVVQAENGGVVMKFITAKLLDHTICLGFGVFPKSESDFRYSTNALHLSIDGQKYIAATYVIRYSDSGRNWRMIDIEEFHNLPEAEPLLRQFSERVEEDRINTRNSLEEEQLQSYQKKFTF